MPHDAPARPDTRLDDRQPLPAPSRGNDLRSRPKNLAQYIVEAIMDRIRGETLRPGDKLPTEAAMMREFGVSRTVVREALSRLQANGVAETRHGIGSFILPASELESVFQNAGQSPVTIRDVIAMMELRISLETEAVGMAALRASEAQVQAIGGALEEFAALVTQQDFAIEADKAFHMAIAEATGNKYFVQIFGYLGEVIPRARLDTPRFGSESRKEFLARTHREHEAIFSAIARKDPESAKAAMRVHLNSSLDRLVKALEKAEAAAGA